jgi:hypothetical protein
MTMIDIDGKYLQGSKRRESQLPAPQVLTVAAQRIDVVFDQGPAAETGTLKVSYCVAHRNQQCGEDGCGPYAPGGHGDHPGKEGYLGLLKGNPREIIAAVVY